MTAWDKTNIIHFLSDLNDYSSYLEICTPTTGVLYHKIDRARFKRCHRLMYRCPGSYDDGMDVNFRSSDMRTKDLFETIQALGFRYDIVLVDPFHTYDISYRDLVDALGIITDRGTVVVHDCFPDSEDLVDPDFTPGNWCGVTFMAFIDFLKDHPELAYSTVDTDYGCGVFGRGGVRPTMQDETINGWDAARRDAKAAYRFLSENSGPLLNLMSVEAFKGAELARTRPG
jgi:hypothetical protein